MPDSSKTHHFNPQLLLRGFANDADRVETFDLSEHRSFVQGIDKAGAQNGWNAFRLGDGTTSDFLEKVIGEHIEGPAGAAISRIRDGGWIDSGHERASVARLIAFQSVRIPRHRNNVDASADFITKLHVAAGGLGQLREVMTAIAGHDPTDEELQAQWASIVTRRDESVVALPTEQHVIDSLDHVDGLARILVGTYSWGVVRWAKPSLLTCDAPLLLVPGPDAPRFYGLALGTAGSVYLGLGRRTALVLHHRDALDMPNGFERHGEADTAKSLNRMSTRGASRWLYHHPDDTLDSLLGADFLLPKAETVTHDRGNNAKVLDALIGAAEYAAGHPDEPHPLSKLTSPDIPPGARPLRLPGQLRPRP